MHSTLFSVLALDSSKLTRTAFPMFALIVTTYHR